MGRDKCRAGWECVDNHIVLYALFKAKQQFPPKQQVQLLLPFYGRFSFQLSAAWAWMSTCMDIRLDSIYCKLSLSLSHSHMDHKILMLVQFFSPAGPVHWDKVADKHIPAASVRRVSCEVGWRDEKGNRRIVHKIRSHMYLLMFVFFFSFALNLQR